MEANSTRKELMDDNGRRINCPAQNHPTEFGVSSLYLKHSHNKLVREPILYQSGRKEKQLLY